MGLNLSVNILTSTFLVTVLAFFLITGILFFYAYVKVGQILEQGNSRTNDLETLNSFVTVNVPMNLWGKVKNFYNYV